MKSLVNEYGVIPARSEFDDSVRDDMVRLEKLLKPVLDEVSLHELPNATRHIEGWLAGILASYTLERQMLAKKARRAGHWQPGLGGPGYYYPAVFTIDDVNWFHGYMLNTISWAAFERGDYRGSGASFLPDYWNGHHKPAFTMEQVEVLAKAINTQTGRLDFFQYEDEGDTWYVKDPNEDAWDGYQGFEATLLGGEVVKLYSIGAGYWMWDGTLDLGEVQNE